MIPKRCRFDHVLLHGYYFHLVWILSKLELGTHILWICMELALDELHWQKKPLTWFIGLKLRVKRGYLIENASLNHPPELGILINRRNMGYAVLSNKSRKKYEELIFGSVEKTHFRTLAHNFLILFLLLLRYSILTLAFKYLCCGYKHS